MLITYMKAKMYAYHLPILVVQIPIDKTYTGNIQFICIFMNYSFKYSLMLEFHLVPM